VGFPGILIELNRSAGAQLPPPAVADDVALRFARWSHRYRAIRNERWLEIASFRYRVTLRGAQRLPSLRHRSFPRG